MKIYRVGGSVRDQLLGLPISDNDYVVTGSSPEQMIADGFTPVGKDFPVFLHPKSKEEYALARTERKSAPGYRGFVFHCAPEITIEEDLQRRDLTINAMAIDDGGNIIDPFGGQRDLAAGIFRHVSDAFLEDPVRILRVARFAARFPTFSVAPETLLLMQTMVQNGEVDALVPERVWQEIARGLMEKHPSRMITVLEESGALTRIFPLASHINKEAADRAANLEFSLAVRWAAMLAMQDESVAKQLGTRLRVPNEVNAISLLTIRERIPVLEAFKLNSEAVVQLLERCDAFRRPERLKETIQAVRCLNLGADVSDQALLLQALAEAKAIQSDKIVQETTSRFPNQPQHIAKAIFAARVAAVRKLLHS